MTTTPELHELAKDPQAFDTILAELHAKRDGQARTVESFTSRLHELARDLKRYRNTRVPVWGLSDKEVIEQAQRRAAYGDEREAGATLGARAVAQAMLDAINFEIANMNAVYALQGNRWTRFFPSVTKSQPHIHRTLHCRTLHATTVMAWAPQLSGKTDEEAVAELDEALCTVCFPNAPVALHIYVSRRSQEAQAARQAEKDARARTISAKRLAPGEVFRTTGRFGERIETVAACKDVIRKAVEQAVEVEYYADDAHMTAKMGWADAAQVAQFRANIASNLADMQADAIQAENVLTSREQAHEGWGMTTEAIAEMKARKDNSARKAWGL